MKKGEAAYSIPSLFAITPFSAYLFDQIGPQIGAKVLMRIIDERDAKEVINQFDEMKEQSRNIPRYIFEEWVFRDVGYILTASNRTLEAIEIFKLNVQLHPKSREAHKDLAEARRRG